MSVGAHHIGLDSGVQKIGTFATAPILYGHACLYDVADNNLITRSGADNASNFKGVALYDSAGDDTEVGLCYEGVCVVKNTSGGAIAAEAALVTSSGGGFKAAAAGNLNLVGRALEAANNNDLFRAYIGPTKLV